jgi:hypothetical protein
MRKVILLILIVLIFSSLSGCVGTIKDTTPPNTTSTNSIDTAVQGYTGVISATPVANDKIEVVFLPVVADSDSIAYVIRYDGQVTPTYIYGSGLKLTYPNRLKYTVKNLNSNTAYSLSVQARNIKSGVESTNTNIKTAQTFTNLTANFNGISELQHLNGVDGTTGIKVLWLPAEKKGYDTTPSDEIDALIYKITVINGSACTPNFINDPAAPAECEKKTLSATYSDRSLNVTGLKPNTKYYIQVRCVHNGYTQNSLNPSYKVEVNTNYLELTTFDSSGSSIPFNESSFLLSHASGLGGLTAVKANWDAAGGAFDHYRICYSQHVNGNSIGAFHSALPSGAGSIICQFINASSTDFTVAGLSNNTKYDFYFAICGNSICDNANRKEISNLQSISTTPNIAAFSGITSLIAAKSINTINQIDLNFNSPDVTNGAFSDFRIEYYGASPDNALVGVVNDALYVGPLGNLFYNPQSTSLNTITVTGTNVGTNYCFKLVPYLLGVDPVASTSNLIKCVIPTIIPPTSSDFSGFSNYLDTNACESDNNKITLEWTTPSNGVFDSYEIYYNASSGLTFPGLNFGTAKTDVRKIHIDYDPSKTTNTFTINNLDSSQRYTFGILTKYQPASGSAIYSNDNTQTINCKTNTP